MYHIIQGKVIIEAKLFKWMPWGKKSSPTTALGTTIGMEKTCCHGDRLMHPLQGPSILQDVIYKVLQMKSQIHV